VKNTYYPTCIFNSSGAIVAYYSTQDMVQIDTPVKGKIVSLGGIKNSLPKETTGVQELSNNSIVLEDFDGEIEALHTTYDLRNLILQVSFFNPADSQYYSEIDYMIDTFEWDKGKVKLGLSNPHIERWSEQYPKDVADSSIFYDMPTKDMGRAIPICLGESIPKSWLVLVRENLTDDIYDYIIGYGRIKALADVYWELGDVVYTGSVILEGTGQLNFADRLYDYSEDFLVSNVEVGDVAYNMTDGTGPFEILTVTQYYLVFATGTDPFPTGLEDYKLTEGPDLHDGSEYWATGNPTSVATANRLDDSGGDFINDGVTLGDIVKNETTGEWAFANVVTATTITLMDEDGTAKDIFDDTGDTYYVASHRWYYDDGEFGYAFVRFTRQQTDSDGNYPELYADINGLMDFATLNGTATGTTTDKLVASGGNFVNHNVQVGDVVRNTTDTTETTVTARDSATQLTLADDIFVDGEAYSIYCTQLLKRPADQWRRFISDSIWGMGLQCSESSFWTVRNTMDSWVQVVGLTCSIEEQTSAFEIRKQLSLSSRLAYLKEYKSNIYLYVDGQVKFSNTSVSGGTATTDTTNQLIDSGADFVTDGVEIWDVVLNADTLLHGFVGSVLNATTVTIVDEDGANLDLFPDGDENYTVGRNLRFDENNIKLEKFYRIPARDFVKKIHLEHPPNISRDGYKRESYEDLTPPDFGVEKEYKMPYTRESSVFDQTGWWIINHNTHQDLRVIFKTGHSAMAVDILDTITISYTDMGIANKLFQVLAVEKHPDYVRITAGEWNYNLYSGGTEL